MSESLSWYRTVFADPASFRCALRGSITRLRNPEFSREFRRIFPARRCRIRCPSMARPKVHGCDGPAPAYVSGAQIPVHLAIEVPVDDLIERRLLAAVSFAAVRGIVERGDQLQLFGREEIVLEILDRLQDVTAAADATRCRLTRMRIVPRWYDVIALRGAFNDVTTSRNDVIAGCGSANDVVTSRTGVVGWWGSLDDVFASRNDVVVRCGFANRRTDVVGWWGSLDDVIASRNYVVAGRRLVDDVTAARGRSGRRRLDGVQRSRWRHALHVVRRCRSGSFL